MTPMESDGLLGSLVGLPTGWDTVSQGIMRDYVERGGTLVMTGTNVPWRGAQRDATFLNEIFPGWNVVSVNDSSTCFTTTINSGNIVGTPWQGMTNNLDVSLSLIQIIIPLICFRSSFSKRVIFLLL